MNEVYLDHAATAPIRTTVIEAMARTMRDVGNPSSLHSAGRRARSLVELAREQIAEVIGAHPVEIIFTGGATEADNLAITGGYWTRRASDDALVGLAISPTEHPAVHDTARWLSEHSGAVLHWLDIDPYGAAIPDALAGLLADRPIALAAAMWANNEVGTLSDIAALAAVCAGASVPLHVDAVQALGRVPIAFADLGIDSMAISAHKVGGPQGVGALIATRAFNPVPLTHGGGQERRIRSGTLDVAGIVGMGVAVVEAEAERVAESQRLAALRARLRTAIGALPGVLVNGYPDESPDRSHPGILSLSTEGADADAVLMLLDSEGVNISTGSACTSGVSEPSHVILAITDDPRRAKQTIRISLGRTTTDADVDRLLSVVPDVIDRARRAGSGRRNDE